MRMITNQKKVEAIHRSIMCRCYSASAKSYRYYGARGICVDKRWHSMAAFIRDMLPSYKPGMQIDRICNNRGCSPENCRWVTRKQNCRNTRRTLFLTVNGIERSLSEWAEVAGIKFATIYYRFTQGRTAEDCIASGRLEHDRSASALKAWKTKRRMKGEAEV